MKHAIYAFLSLMLGFDLAAQADRAPKVIDPTRYCSQMQLIDQAPSWEGQDPLSVKADRLVVSKTRKKLYLLNQGRVMSQYDVSFGFGFKNGAKERRGDGRTPEGLYEIDLKKKVTSYHLALQVSYPNEADEVYARKNGFDPGSNILIHGLPGRPVDDLIPEVVRRVHGSEDWTQGCMAVTDHEIEEIFELVDAHVPLEICPFETN